MKVKKKRKKKHNAKKKKNNKKNIKRKVEEEKHRKALSTTLNKVFCVQNIKGWKNTKKLLRPIRGSFSSFSGFCSVENLLS